MYQVVKVNADPVCALLHATLFERGFVTAGVLAF
jgi:hypothetical protein